MALSRAAGLCRLALRSQWAATRLLSSVAAGGEPQPGGECEPGPHLAVRRERAPRPPTERTQLAPLRKASSIPRPSNEQRQLNADIGACASAEAVLDLATARPTLLNGVNVCTALMKLAKLVGKNEPAQWLESDARFQQLLAAAVPLMERKAVNERGLATLLFACGQLGIVPSSTWLAVFWGSSSSALPNFVPQNLCTALLACGQLGITPPPDWLQRFWDISGSKVGEFSPHSLSNLQQVFEQLGIVPPAKWLQHFRLPLTPRHSSATSAGDEPAGDEDKPRRLIDSTRLRALVLRRSAVRTQPAQPRTARGTMSLMRDQWKLNAAISSCTSAEAVLELALACPALWNGAIVPTALMKIAKLFVNGERMQWLESDARFQRLFSIAVPLMMRGELDARGFANLICACGQLGIAPSLTWLAFFWTTSALKLGEFKPQDLRNTLYACGQLGITPPADWLQCYCKASAVRLHKFNPQELIDTLRSFERLGITPSGEWLQRYWNGSGPKLRECAPHNLSNLMHACGQMGITPPPDWLQHYWHAIGLKLGEFEPQDFSKALHACEKLGITPPADWLRCKAQPTSPSNKHGIWERASLEQLQLNEDIQACVSAEAVLDLATACPVLLNGVNVATALMKLAKLVGKDEPVQWLESDARFQQLLITALPLMARKEVDAYGFTNLIYACGQLGIVPSATWLAAFWGISLSALDDFMPQGLSTTLYACGQLSITPPPDWLERFWHASDSKLRKFNEQDLTNTFYACGRLGITPPADWLRQFWLVSTEAIDAFVPLGLSSMMYSSGLLGITPPADWLQRFWRASGTKLGDFSPLDCSNTLHGCGQLGITPPADWLQRYWRASASKLDEFKPQDFSNTFYACLRLSITPHADWLQRYWHTSASKMSEIKPQTINIVLYACGQEGITPPRRWLQLYWHASAMKLGEFKPPELSTVLYACGQLGITPPADWLQHYWDASSPKLGEFIPQNFSNTLYACGQLSITPPDEWLQRYWDASALQLGEFIPQGFSNTLHACGLLGITPPADWLQHYWHASFSKLGEFNLQELSNTMLACAQLDVRPPSDWLQSYSSSFEQLLPNANHQDLANTALALASRGLWELPVWTGLWERLCQSLPRDPAEWNAEIQLHARQLYQTYQAATVERPGLLSEPDAEMLAAVRRSWVDGRSETVSRLHADVSACLTRMGVAHANERWCERAERSIDIAIEGARARVAVEVDGPHHFLQDGRQDGSTLLRNKMLAAHGWRVVVVDYREWEELETQSQQEDYLRSLLA